MRVWRIKTETAPLQSLSGKGSLAQLVQSICLTSRGSGVRIPQLPQKAFIFAMRAFFMRKLIYIFILLGFCPFATLAQTYVQKPIELSSKLDSLADSLARSAFKVKYLNGFRISIYSGIKRDDATKAKQRVYNLDPDLSVYTVYKQPTFRVQVGNYVRRKDCIYDYGRLKPLFPDALIVPSKIEIQGR